MYHLLNAFFIPIARIHVFVYITSRSNKVVDCDLVNIFAIQISICPASIFNCFNVLLLIHFYSMQHAMTSPVVDSDS